MSTAIFPIQVDQSLKCRVSDCHEWTLPNGTNVHLHCIKGTISSEVIDRCSQVVFPLLMLDDEMNEELSVEMRWKFAVSREPLLSCKPGTKIPRIHSKPKVCLFVGSTGTGKTEVVKAAASIKQEESGSSAPNLDRLLFVRMNEYIGEHDAVRFFGLQPGYRGAEDPPAFAKQLDKYAKGKGESRTVEDVIILFDEMEKAHAKVKQSLLTLLDEGSYQATWLERGNGIDDKKAEDKKITVTYLLKGCVIIGTSNLYANQLLEAFNRGRSIIEIQELFRTLNVTHPHPDSFSPEWLGRGQIIPFGPIPRGECYQRLLLAKMTIFFQRLSKELACKKVDIENSDGLMIALETLLYGQGVDLRRIERYFEVIEKQVIVPNKTNWGDPSNIKLTFYNDANGIKLRVSIFDLGEYEPHATFLLPAP